MFRESSNSQALEAVVQRFSLGDLFDRAGQLIPLQDLAPHIAAEIASFEIVRITTRGGRETITTEELIRVKTRDRRTAGIAKRGGGSLSPNVFIQQPLGRRLVTTRERSAGRGRTRAAHAAVPKVKDVD